MLRKSIATLLIVVLSIAFAWTQTIEGQIIDAETKAGIPYASIGVLNKGIGTVSDEKGYFLLSWTDAKKITQEDSLAFLHIGYQTLRLGIADVMTKANATKPIFSLEKEEIELPTISIEADEFKNEVVLGRKVEKQSVNLYYQSNQKGTELAAFVKVDQSSYLKKAYFAIASNNYKQLYFRVNLYTINEGKPSDRIN
ncbi:MAG: carboxypeptidase-like regulatory domain-containing protein, partial [Bacteroidota bacterium]